MYGCGHAIIADRGPVLTPGSAIQVTPETVSEIDICLNNLSDAIMTNSKLIEELESRLDRLLYKDSEPKEDISGYSEATILGVTLAERTNTIMKMNQQLSSIIRRLAL